MSVLHFKISLTAPRRPQTIMIESSLSSDALKLHNAIQAGSFPEDVPQTPIESVGADSRFTHRPLSQWECLAPRGVPTEMHMPSEPLEPLEPVSRQDTPTLHIPTEPRFSRFIRQMKDAGPKLILDKLKSNLAEVMDDAADEEVI